MTAAQAAALDAEASAFTQWELTELAAWHRTRWETRRVMAETLVLVVTAAAVAALTARTVTR